MFENLEKYLNFVMFYLKMFEKDLGVFYIGIVMSNGLFDIPRRWRPPKSGGIKEYPKHLYTHIQYIEAIRV